MISLLRRGKSKPATLPEILDSYIRISTDIIRYYLQLGIEATRSEDFEFSYCFRNFLLCLQRPIDRNSPQWHQMEEQLFKGIVSDEKFVRVSAIFLASKSCAGDAALKERLVKALLCNRFMDFETVYTIVSVSGTELHDPAMLDWIMTQATPNIGELSIDIKSLNPKDSRHALLWFAAFQASMIYYDFSSTDCFESIRSYIDHQSWHTKVIAALTLCLLAILRKVGKAETIVYFQGLIDELAKENDPRAKYLCDNLNLYIMDLSLL